MALRDWLGKHELSQGDFAEQLGVTRQHVGMMLGGSPPSLHVAVTIKALTGIPCEAWVEGAAA